MRHWIRPADLKSINPLLYFLHYKRSSLVQSNVGSVIMNKEFIVSIASIAAISMSGKFHLQRISTPVRRKKKHYLFHSGRNLTEWSTWWWHIPLAHVWILWQTDNSEVILSKSKSTLLILWITIWFMNPVSNHWGGWMKLISTDYVVLTS